MGEGHEPDGDANLAMPTVGCRSNHLVVRPVGMGAARMGRVGKGCACPTWNSVCHSGVELPQETPCLAQQSA